METLVIKSNIKKIAIQNEDGEIITEIKINIADADTYSKFMNLLKKTTSVGEMVEARIKELEEKYKDEETTLETLVDVAKVKIDAVNEIIAGIDELFGANTIHNVFKENYEIDNAFIPDEYALADFLEGIVPIMTTFFVERNKANHSKYSKNRRGANE